MRVKMFETGIKQTDILVKIILDRVGGTMYYISIMK
jgi:hypothetical protein